MFCAHIRQPDGTFETTDSMIEAARALRDGANMWVDLEAPDEWTLMLLGEAFNFHPLAIEDCLHGEQRSRIDPYDGHIFMVLYGPLLNEEHVFVGSRELAIFCAPQFIVTIHHLPMHSIQNVRLRCCRDPENILGRGMDHLLHTIVDGVIDGYQPLLDRMEAEVTGLEDAALNDPESALLERISSLKSELLQVRRYITPLREAVGQLARGEYAFIGKNIRPYFRDVLDHLVRTTEMLDLYREQVMGARDVYMSALSQRTNEAMKTLTLFATVMMPLTLISGIYGMNFKTLWPSAENEYGFWIVIAAMVAVSAGLIYFFRRKSLL
ncbi:MAG TPA: magnesium/cobalt transporter CorA [Phycisphaerae bacterium]|nr:magnesium/cobalt transporter CorA [Phycisphaerae bacterium]HOB74815.1 magnesium/cobalt transporter CorA [Phycisphaerae bacterium]HOJ54350.1 magnesium/cobalt transporter CorA [Phycisphaerae bacterium]HOL26821.1 magnesium/cobalt transporter CorA [Phycisphaerae bacterium]HPP19982.1 magnesium/cobalt transporter CorA [Phycisphaerae bacterium]